MNTKNIAGTHDDFEARIDELIVWEGALTGLAATLQHREEWARRRYCESILVSAFSHWERFVEELFCAYLAQDVSKMGKSMGLALRGRVSFQMAAALAVGDGYFDFKSFGDLNGQAKRLLASNPFDKVPHAIRSKLDLMQAMRNHALHASRRSLRQLRQHVNMVREVGKHLAAREGGSSRMRSYLDLMRQASGHMRPP